MARLISPSLLALLLITIAHTAAAQVRGTEWRGVSVMGESNARNNLALRKVMPAYPAEAVEAGVKGIVEVRVGWDVTGTVRRIKVRPGTNPLLKQAVVKAVRQWRFAAYFGPTEIYCSHRLTFEFVIEDGKGRVGLYDPPWESAAGRRLREYGSPLEQKEWEQWEEALNDDPPPVKDDPPPIHDN